MLAPVCVILNLKINLVLLLKPTVLHVPLLERFFQLILDLIKDMFVLLYALLELLLGLFILDLNVLRCLLQLIKNRRKSSKTFIGLSE